MSLEPAIWIDAQAQCVKWGGSLASIHSREEQTNVVSLTEGMGAMWIGLRELPISVEGVINDTA